MNICKSSKELYLYTNAGFVIIDIVGDLPGVRTMQYHPEGIANILSHTCTVTDNGFEVDYSSHPDENRNRDLVYRIETSEGRKLRFSPNSKGLHSLNCLTYFGAGKKGFVFGNKVIKKIEGSNKNFNKRYVKQAETLCCFQHNSGHPSDATLHQTTIKMESKIVISCLRI